MCELPVRVLVSLPTESYTCDSSWFSVEETRTRSSCPFIHELCLTALHSAADWSHPLTFQKNRRWRLLEPEGLVCIHSQLAVRMESLASGLTFRCAFHTLAPQPQVTAPDSCVYLSCMSQLVLLAEQKLLKRILFTFPFPSTSTRALPWPHE